MSCRIEQLLPYPVRGTCNLHFYRRFIYLQFWNSKNYQNQIPAVFPSLLYIVLRILSYRTDWNVLIHKELSFYVPQKKQRQSKKKKLYSD